ncbi:hypothetical protein [Thiomicrorhabdus lithotrophica]|uniref:Uncharacterized protein n=1 Tax=Thiomicrorhabdus lithotrophica TaxID=2949997 RepID=A0ABY8CDP3_9GAMM|nr:hypothetical protein [Thiomicrorhabdus lithotrophica]WEJ62533.1 hypothetical protein NR989_11025 [Thiomicrorhabdus lithotrophica]
MIDKAIEEKKLESLLSIDDSNHTSEQRTSMIIQGVNWLTLVQEILVLFIYKLPAAVISMLQASANKRNPDEY